MLQVATIYSWIVNNASMFLLRQNKWLTKSGFESKDVFNNVVPMCNSITGAVKNDI